MQKIAFKILMAAQWVKLGQVDITIRKHQTRSTAEVLMINKKLTAKQKEENHFGKSFVRICCFFRLI